MKRRYPAAGDDTPPEPFNADWCRRRQFSSSNIPLLLRHRELGLRKEGTNFFHGSRVFYHSLPLARCESLVYRPQIFPLRFTPDGSKLIAIGSSLQEILLFTYRGFQYGARVPAEQLFNTVFPRCQCVQLNPNEQNNVNRPSTSRLQFGFLSRDTAFVTPDSRFLVVSSSIPAPESKSTFRGILRNNESLFPDKNLMDITFFSIDLKKAQLVDRYKFELDQINVPSGAWLCGWTLALLSVQHQTIHMLGIDRQSGHFVPLKQIGHSVLEDDPMVGGAHLISPRTEQVFTAFRQRFLTFLYKEHKQRGQVQQFLHHFDFFRNLKMQKIQSVGPELILIRMDLIAPDSTNSTFGGSSIPSSSSSSSQQQYMFTLLDWRRGQIAGVFSRSSAPLFALFERHNECFRNGHLAKNVFPTSMEHCGPLREQHEFVKQSSYVNSSPADVRRRFLASLPLPNTQHLVSSPLLDPCQFSYDDKLLGLLEKGRYPPEQPLKLFSRWTRRLHTRLDLRFQLATNKSYSYARLLFHPRDPFLISISRGIQPETLISFYMPAANAPQDL